MGQPAARVADMQVCPMFTGPVPHVGGVLAAPAAFTVLIVCMQVKQYTLGFALVAAFSFGLALTMVTVGAVAAEP